MQNLLVFSSFMTGVTKTGGLRYEFEAWTCVLYHRQISHWMKWCAISEWLRPH